MSNLEASDAAPEGDPTEAANEMALPSGWEVFCIQRKNVDGTEGRAARLRRRLATTSTSFQRVATFKYYVSVSFVFVWNLRVRSSQGLSLRY